VGAWHGARASEGCARSHAGREEIRHAQKLGVSFRRQVVLGNALADFFAPSIRLVVEVDGAHHALRRAADARRDRNLVRLGCRVLRVDAQFVLRDLPRAVQLVKDAVGLLQASAPRA
jgi:very-short-patch-repair endonuclease